MAGQEAVSTGGRSPLDQLTLAELQAMDTQAISTELDSVVRTRDQFLDALMRDLERAQNQSAAEAK